MTTDDWAGIAIGCDCTALCEMGPTCPGGMAAGLPGSGCARTGLKPGKWVDLFGIDPDFPDAPDGGEA